ncbi:MAG: tRNA pseudouridine(55) synthase TruB [Parvularculaceae bacterium]|nr:tRNA pseudouridine(55) synthase TruB [Parvularculaceae bacterium]
MSKQRRKKGRPLSGWIILDKSYDVGSTEAVSKLKWLFQAQKAGHAGTLDPLATGVLPVAFGEATKTVPYVMDGAKTYRFTAKWGEATTTDDREGDVIARSDRRPTRAEIEAVLPRFTGAIEQVPPQFSAVKIDGARAYDLAREGATIALEARTIDIHDLTLVDIPDTDHAVFEATTGKGAYVRALVRDIARALQTEGHVAALRRTAVGPFRAEDSVTIEALEKLETPEARDAALLPVDAGLRGLPAAAVGGPEAEKLKRGQPAVISPAVAKGVRGGEAGLIPAVLASLHGEAVAICALDGLKLKPLRVFNP